MPGEIASHEAVANDLVRLKSDLLAKAQYTDDVKSIAGELFEACKRGWNLSQAGMNKHMFMRDVCAPLITPETETFAQLQRDLELR